MHSVRVESTTERLSQGQRLTFQALAIIGERDCTAVISLICEWRDRNTAMVIKVKYATPDNASHLKRDHVCALVARAEKRDLLNQVGRSMDHRTCSDYLPHVKGSSHNYCNTVVNTSLLSCVTRKDSIYADFARQLEAGKTR